MLLFWLKPLRSVRGAVRVFRSVWAASRHPSFSPDVRTPPQTDGRSLILSTNSCFVFVSEHKTLHCRFWGSRFLTDGRTDVCLWKLTTTKMIFVVSSKEFVIFFRPQRSQNSLLINWFGDFYFEKPLLSVGVVSCLLLLTMTMLNDEGGGGVAMLTRAARPDSATQTHSFCFIIF